MMYEICVDFYLCDFDRSYPLVLVLYRYVIIFAESPKYLMMWCPKFLSRELEMKDVEVWQVIDSPRFCSFKFIGDQGHKRGEVRDVVIVYYFVGYKETSKAYGFFLLAQWKTTMR